MNVRHIEREGQDEIDILVTSAPGDQDAAQLVGRLQSFGQMVVGFEPGSIVRRPIPLDELLLIEVRADLVLVRTTDGSELESPLRLYELEEALRGSPVIRASKQVLVNFDKVVSIRPELNRRLLLRLEGGTDVLVTRTYVPNIKRLLGSNPRRS